MDDETFTFKVFKNSRNKQLTIPLSKKKILKMGFDKCPKYIKVNKNNMGF